MNPSLRLRYRRIASWALVCLFVLGFFIPQIGIFTGPTLGVWFVGTQRILRGFLWMLIFGLLFGGLSIVRGAIQAGSGAPVYIAWALLLLVAGILPFSLHRVTGPYLSGFAATLPFPVYSALLIVLEGSFITVTSAGLHTAQSALLLKHIASLLGPAAAAFFVCWFASALAWAWNQEFRGRSMRLGMTIIAAACVVTLGVEALGPAAVSMSNGITLGEEFSVLCLVAGIGFAAWALLASLRRDSWYARPETLSILKSPASGEALRLEGEGRRQVLVSNAGERFSLRYGIPDLRRTEDLAGDNGKYNVLYETIGGFYDHIQRVVCALQGFDGAAYVKSYMNLLEVKPGDAVLETSVGTGLNFQYLPQGVRLVGLDLSPEMLLHCRANMRRWELKADLFLGNAESLPFANESFDVVFHVGGINFFNDRAKAIDEMIRVAKPGSLILIADETEEHVKEMYEQGPITSRFYKDRKEAVAPPVDLVPPQMLDKQLRMLKPMGKNRFYALTFRKPTQVNERSALDDEARVGSSVASW
jgi:ubiquinone/menaquinone biosynthesis C-methylase UbiE